MKTTLAILFASIGLGVMAQAPFTNIYLPGDWPAENWWTNSPPLTNVVASNAWYAVNENFRRASNAVAAVETQLAGDETALSSAIAGVSNAVVTLAGSLPDAATNAMLNSYRVPAIVSNSVVISAGATNVLGWVTNLAGVEFTVTSGLMTNSGFWGSNAPVLLYSLDGTNWGNRSAGLVTNVPVQLAFYSGSVPSNPPTMEVPIPGAVTNVTAYRMVRPDLFGRTNAMFGETLLVSDPLQAQEAAPKHYVDDLFATAFTWSVPTDVQVNGHAINLSSTWLIGTDSLTNSTAYHLRFLGNEVITATASQPVSVTNGSVSLSGTNILVKVPTNGLAVAPQLEFSHYIIPPVWAWLTNAASVSGTNYTWTMAKPFGDAGFLIAMVASTNPVVVNIPGMLSLAPRTVTNATDTTWGYGAGMVCVDSNYVYISVATNTWKRAGLSSW